MNHCKKLAIFDLHALEVHCPSTQNVAEGWVGVKDGKFFFKPDRGSGGFALYDSEANALRNTGALSATKVSLKLAY